MIIYLLVLIFSISGIKAQNIKVFDKITFNPIPNTVIVNQDKSVSVQTNNKGIANISNFSTEDSLKIIHTAYANVFSDIATIREDNYIVYLMPAIMQLEETVVSASRRAESRYDIPYRISGINPKQIEIYQPQTSADMLATSGEVFVQKSQMGGGSPMIRGFGSNRVLLVVDGVRMNNAIFRHGNLHNLISLDANSLESVEVIFGPGSVGYGSDAIGGVFSFITKNPEFSEEGVDVSGAAMVRYSSANSEKTTSANIEISGERLASLTAISYSDYGDLVAGKTHPPDTNYLRRHTAHRFGGRDTIIRHTDRHIMRGTGYNYFNIMQKVRFRLSEKMELNYGFHFSQTSDIPRFDRLNLYQGENELRFTEWHYGPQKWIMNNLQLKYANHTKYFDEININIAHQNYQESRHQRRFKNPNRFNRFENVNVLSTNVDFHKAINSRQTFNYGVEAVYNLVGSKANTKNIENGIEIPIATRYPNGSELYSTAAYLSYKNNLNNHFTLTGGARFSYSHINADLDTTFFDFPITQIINNTAAPTASVGGIYKLNSKLNISLNLSSGYRAPNIDDIAKIFDSEPGAVVVPNENLKPEYIYSADLGVTKRLYNKLEFNVTGFYSYLNNIMVRRDFSINGQDSIFYDGELSRVQAIVNADHAIIYGLSSSLKYNLNDFIEFKSNISWTDGFDNNNSPLRHVTPIFGSTHLILKAEGFTLDIYAVYNGEISPDRLSIEEHSKTFMYAKDKGYAQQQMLLPEHEQFNPNGLYSPGWHTLNFNMSYQIAENVRLNFGVENITNVMYRTYSSGIPAFGRNIIFGVRGNF